MFLTFFTNFIFAGSGSHISGCFRLFVQKISEVVRTNQSLNGMFSLYDCRLSGRDTQSWRPHSNPTCCNKKNELFALTGGGDAKTFCLCDWCLLVLLALEPPEQTLIFFKLAPREIMFAKDIPFSFEIWGNKLSKSNKNAWKVNHPCCLQFKAFNCLVSCNFLCFSRVDVDELICHCPSFRKNWS